MQHNPQDSIFSRDLRSLSLFRIFFAAYLLADFFINTFSYFAAFYGSDGILPISVLAAIRIPGAGNMALFAVGLEATKIPAILWIVYPIALIIFGIGYRTRWAAAVAFVLNVYLFWRNPYLQSGAELLSRLLLLWSLFLPLDRYWCVAPQAEMRESSYLAWPFLAIRLQISSLYLFSALFKLAGSAWRDGYAVIWALSDNVFGSTPAGLFLVDQFPALLYGVNYLTIAFQIAFPFLVYCPWRNDWTRAIALACAATMHISFIFCLNIGGFPYLSLISLVLLVPDRWLARLPGRSMRGATQPSETGGSIGKPALALCILLTVLALTSNVASIARLWIKPPQWLFETLAVFQVAQHWDLFAPLPTHWRKDLRIVLQMPDGSRADLMQLLPEPLFWWSDDRRRINFVNHRWLKYFTQIEDSTETEWKAFAEYLCRRVRDRTPGLNPDSSIELTVSRRSIDDSNSEEMTFHFTSLCL